ncbi:MAG: hypothetical protein FWD05_06770 [Oscillospiraceae bacterium]|nr:hypothetical protein [Oscillospiraceae bacterium]
MQEFTFEDIKMLIHAIYKSKLLIFLITLAGLCAGLFFHARNPVTYTYNATSTVSVVFDIGMTPGQLAGTGVLSGFAEIITSYRVAEYGAHLLSDESITASELINMINVNERAGAPILRIVATNESPRLAILAANAAAESFVSQVAFITGTQSIEMLDPAREANLTLSVAGRNIAIMAPIVAFFMSIALVIFIELYTGKIRSVKQCAADMGEIIAVIPKLKLGR